MSRIPYGYRRDRCLADGIVFAAASPCWSRATGGAPSKLRERAGHREPHGLDYIQSGSGSSNGVGPHGSDHGGRSEEHFPCRRFFVPFAVLPLTGKRFLLGLDRKRRGGGPPP